MKGQDALRGLSPILSDPIQSNQSVEQRIVLVMSSSFSACPSLLVYLIIKGVVVAAISAAGDDETETTIDVESVFLPHQSDDRLRLIMPRT